MGCIKAIQRIATPWNKSILCHDWGVAKEKSAWLVKPPKQTDLKLWKTKNWGPEPNN